MVRPIPYASLLTETGRSGGGGNTRGGGGQSRIRVATIGELFF